MDRGLDMAWVVKDVTEFDRLPDVIALYRMNKARLGLWPDEAIQDRARASNLLGVFDDSSGTFGGYALYSLVRDQITLWHLCVSDEFRGTGLARRLVDAIREKHPYRQGISLRCRRDYNLEGMWTSLGFFPVNERPGRSLRKDTLTTWRRSFGHATLFDWRAGTKMPVVIDVNVLEDLSVDRATSEATRIAIGQDWILAEVELVVTPQSLIEIDRTPDEQLRVLLRNAYRQYPELQPDAEGLSHALAILESAIPSQPTSRSWRSDLRQIASAASAGIGTFITSDTELIARAGPLAREPLGVMVHAPSELAGRLSELSDAHSYNPSALAKTDLILRPLRAGEFEQVADHFLKKVDGERLADLRERVKVLRASGDEFFCVEDGHGHLVGLFSRRQADASRRIGLFRVKSTIGNSLAQHLLAVERDTAGALGAKSVVVSDPHLSELRTAFQSEGYVESGSEWIAHVVSGVASTNHEALSLTRLNKAKVRKEFPIRRAIERLQDAQPLDAQEAVDLETLFAPLKLSNANVTCLLVPIRAGFAEELFDVELSNQKLFNRSRQLGLAREQVYYRSPAIPSGMTMPARILWYVSEDRRRPGTKAVKAYSVLRDIDVSTPEVLFERYRRLGALSREQISKVASKTNRVSAMRFTNTEVFETPVSLKRLSALAENHQHKLFLRSISSLPPGLFAEIYRAGAEGHR